MSITIDKTQPISLDPAAALRFFDINKYSGQRPLSARHLSDIRTEMTSGRFLQGQIAVANCNYPSAKYPQVLVNGQHTCHSVISTNVTVAAVLTIYTVTSEDELAQLFGSFDPRCATRTADAMNRTIYDRLGVNWSTDVLSWIVKTVSWLDGKYRFTRGSLERRAMAIGHQHVPFGNFVQRILRGDGATKDNRRHLLHQGVLGAMFETFKASPTDALTFWLSVRDGTNVPATDPAYKLRQFLIGLPGSLPAEMRKWSDPNLAVYLWCKCVCGWNAWKTGTPTDLKVYKEKNTGKFRMPAVQV